MAWVAKLRGRTSLASCQGAPIRGEAWRYFGEKEWDQTGQHPPWRRNRYLEVKGFSRRETGPRGREKRVLRGESGPRVEESRKRSQNLGGKRHIEERIRTSRNDLKEGNRPRDRGASNKESAFEDERYDLDERTSKSTAPLRRETGP